MSMLGFIEARENPDSPKRDFYGRAMSPMALFLLCGSAWEFDEASG